jgi:hypothetical protein
MGKRGNENEGKLREKSWEGKEGGRKFLLCDDLFVLASSALVTTETMQQPEI